MAAGDGAASKGVHSPVVVFDIDLTLWPFWVDTHVSPPFRKKGGKINDRYGKSISLYPDIVPIFTLLRDKGIRVAYASRTDDPDASFELQALVEVLPDGTTMDKAAAAREIYPGDKEEHLNKIAKKLGVELKDLIFFDDEPRNIRTAKRIGIGYAEHVDDSVGVTMKQLKRALAKFGL